MDKDEIYYSTTELTDKLLKLVMNTNEEKSVINEISLFFTSLPLVDIEMERIGENLVLTPVNNNNTTQRILLYSTLKSLESLATLCGVFLFFSTNERHNRYQFTIAINGSADPFEGLKEILPRLHDFDFAIVAAPTGMNPAIESYGLMEFSAEIKTSGGSIDSENAENAIYKALPVVSALRSLRMPLESNLIGPVKFIVNNLEATARQKNVPSVCRFNLQILTNHLYSGRQIFEKIVTSVPDYCNISLHHSELRSPYLPLSNPVMSRLTSLGKTPFGIKSLSEQAMMPWPSMTLGPGNEYPANSDSETRGFEIREALEIFISVLS